MSTVKIFAIPGVPDVRPGDDLAAQLGDALAAAGGLQDGDVICVAHKVVSKAEGNVIDLSTVTPSEYSIRIAGELNRKPAKVEVVLSQSARILRAFKRPDQNEGTLICEHRLGYISANAAVDESNAGRDNTVITLPDDPDASARHLGCALESRFGVEIGVVITDTFGRPWRRGQVNVAIGLHRVPARTSDVGDMDAWGRTLSVTEPALSDEIAAASGLVVAKAAKMPLVRIRGLTWQAAEKTSAQDILRTSKEDVFR
ncbi:MAG: coenzyme F420-0:L-glutamate ligase [Rhodobacteraceae bacterium]|nr:coenzyme F420-0:L-glutamate ligase [Paracoccaceae bacterium]